ncbi:2-succinylbenzoate--CoA ligase, chloroplastic/peroxisomal isoform X2 [Phalaenopsis equestris]|uniref:2-succinylbenzoate--CoA ligase, chloroplastic/peroxisomal isoform X2 n=1 Tax=Phalaenopsis equestris TaxID=78828 RepID=UPI0009E41496|nr:2-succinylbenzoate--CoA ligase, chloroplastic/peroxisomal isoform X2 [Phalaenopsis equestris]
MANSQCHIAHFLTRLVQLKQGCPAIISGNRRRTGGEFVDGVLGLARGLLELGLLFRGEVVVIAALNSDWYLEWILAVTYVGGIIAPLNYRWSIEEARSALEVLKPVILVVDEFCSSWVVQLTNSSSIKSLRLHALIGCNTLSNVSKNANSLSMDSIRKPSQGTQFIDPIYAINGIALICFTSGTTGQPRGVAISHKALVIQSLAKITIVGYAEDDVYLHTAPLCHIGGISSCIAMIMAGGCHVFIPKFGAKLASAAFEQNHVTSLITVPAMLADLISFARKSNRWNGETVNKILNGGGSLSTELVKGAIDLFPNAKIISAYGMTEACSSLTFMLIFDPSSQKLRKSPSCSEILESNSLQLYVGVCVGKPPPHIELKICCDPTISSSPMVGSILTRGLHVMIGYWDQLTKTSNCDKSCWLNTGDIGWLDSHGNLWLVGRTKDRIKSGGENIYPEEVEAVLCQHIGVAGAVVVGIPDTRLTEKIVACVSIEEDWIWVNESARNSLEANLLSSEIMQNFCRHRKLTGFKIPKVYMPWRKPFPLTTTGKLRREDVKKEITLEKGWRPMP